ncbi:MAG: TIR domain-containing protein [Succinivibrio sp.]|nr:TIR domain-containing protein [Succinivibrio sp.]
MPRQAEDDLRQALAEAIGHYQLKVGTDLLILHGFDKNNKNDRYFSGAAVALLWYPGANAAQREQIELQAKSALQSGVQAVTVVTSRVNLRQIIQDEALRRINALENSKAELEALPGVILNALGLTRSDRKVFVSYRRDSNRNMAVHLHDRLSAAGFDVFLDTHDIPPGVDFQKTLERRLIDCDVVVMLLSEDSFKSEWVQKEFCTAYIKGIPLLLLVPASVSHLAFKDFLAGAFSEHLTVSELIAPANSGSKTHAWRLNVKGASPLISLVRRKCEQLMSVGFARRMQDLRESVLKHLEASSQLSVANDSVRSITYTVHNAPANSQLKLALTIKAPGARDFTNLPAPVKQGKAHSTSPVGHRAVVYEDFCLDDGLKTELDFLNGRLHRARFIPCNDNIERHRGVLEADPSQHLDERKYPVLFLSASLPLNPNDPAWKDYLPIDRALVQIVLRDLLVEALGRGYFIWGGHPGITPILARICEEFKLDPRERCKLYQSRHFEGKYPAENRSFGPTVEYVGKANCPREEGLMEMRLAMLSKDITHAVFIGGKDGVEAEFNILHQQRPNCLTLALAAPGGAARELVKRCNRSPETYGLTEHSYSTLFREFLSDGLAEKTDSRTAFVTRVEEFISQSQDKDKGESA